MHIKKKINNCYKKILFLKNLTDNNYLKYFYKNNKFYYMQLKQNFISYILKVNITKSNIFLIIKNINNQLILSISSGIFNYTTKRQKKNLEICSKFFNFCLKYYKELFYNSFSFFFKNTKKNYRNNFIKYFKKIFIIKNIENYNLKPFNGCRKRKKKKTRNLFLIPN